MMTVMFDTGSSIMYVMSTKCKRGCPDRLEKFDQDNSGTFQYFQKQRQDQNYGSGFVTGAMALDQVCFGNTIDKCDNYKFLLVDGGNELQKD